MLNQVVIPVVNSHKALEKFLRREEEWCVLMDFHINFMEDILQRLHAQKKKGIVHMDLIKGVQNDLYGTQFMCQTYRADGIISTKRKAIEAAKQQNCISILRVFLLDSRSLVSSSQLAENLQPDYVEVLPAIIPRLVQRMQKHCHIPLIGGGLIESRDDIKQCLSDGMIAVTTSDMSLCDDEGAL